MNPIEKFSEDFHAATKSALELFDIAMGLTERQVLDNLQPGAVVPKIDQPTGEALDLYSAKLETIRNDLKSKLTVLQRNISRDLATPLSPEDAATLQVLAMRENVTQPELDAYYNTYKDKSSAIGLLDSIAKKNGLRTSDISFEVPDYQTIDVCIDRINPSYIGRTPSNLRLNEDVVNNALGIRRNDAYVPIFFH